MSKRRTRRIAAKTRRIAQEQAVRRAQSRQKQAEAMGSYYAKRCREMISAELSGETVLPEGYMSAVLGDMGHKLAREMAERIMHDHPELSAKLKPGIIRAAQEMMDGIRPMAVPGHQPRYDRMHDPLMDRVTLRLSVPPLNINYAVPLEAMVAAR